MQVFFEVCMSVIVLFFINVQLALISFCFFGASLLVFQLIKKILYKATINSTVAGINFNSILQDILARQSLIIASNNEENENNFFVGEYRELMKKRFYFEQIQNLLNPLFMLFQMFAVIVTAVLLGNTVLFSQVHSASAALVFIVMFHRGLTRVQNVATLYIQRLSSRDSLALIIQDIIHLKPSVHSGPVHFEKMKTGITCKNLSFSYAKDDENVINNLSFSIPT